MRPIIKSFQETLIAWYQENKRTLPFRDIKNPYFTWVSEIMLQQTQVDTAIPYFERFIKHFPTICDCANASLDEVLKLWEGLGYYRRARHLHETAKVICNDYKGVFPDDLKTIESLKGIGRYISRAIYSIAFDKKAAAVDGNVIRVMSRIYGDDRDFTKIAHIKALENQVYDLIEDAKPSDFTQGLMELGALVCQKKPKCEVCPFQETCAAYQEDSIESLPYLPKKTKKSHHIYHVFVVMKEGNALLVKRDPNGLLANLYTFPQYGGTYPEALKQFESDFNIEIQNTEFKFDLKHVFSHQTWLLNVYLITLKDTSILKLVSLNDFPYAIAKAHLNIIDKL